MTNHMLRGKFDNASIGKIIDGSIKYHTSMTCNVEELQPHMYTSMYFALLSETNDMCMHTN